MIFQYCDIYFSDEIQTTPGYVPGYCPGDNWEEFGSSCYLFMPSQPHLNYSQARMECVTFGGQSSVVTTVLAQYEQDFIAHKMNENNPGQLPIDYWIGLVKNIDGK